MEPEFSLPHSQVPATCPYTEPARSSPYPYISLHEDPSEYYPPIYAWVSPMVSLSLSLPQVSPPKPCTRLSPPPYTLYDPTHLILLDFITRTILRGKYYLVSYSILGFQIFLLQEDGQSTIINTVTVHVQYKIHNS